MVIGTISEKGQLVIPKKFRVKYGLKAKSQVEWIDTGQGLMLIPIPKDPVKSSRGMLKSTGSQQGHYLRPEKGIKN